MRSRPAGARGPSGTAGAGPKELQRLAGLELHERPAGLRRGGASRVRNLRRVEAVGVRPAVPPPLRTKWTRRVPHPVLIGHALRGAVGVRPALLAGRAAGPSLHASVVEEGMDAPDALCGARHHCDHGRLRHRRTSDCAEPNAAAKWLQREAGSPMPPPAASAPLAVRGRMRAGAEPHL